MPNASAIASLQALKKYNDLVEALKNFNQWGIQFQTIAADLQDDSNYLSVFTGAERTALTNFLSSINSIIPIANIPNPVS